MTSQPQFFNIRVLNPFAFTGLHSLTKYPCHRYVLTEVNVWDRESMVSKVHQNLEGLRSLLVISVDSLDGVRQRIEFGKYFRVLDVRRDYNSYSASICDCPKGIVVYK